MNLSREIERVSAWRPGRVSGRVTHVIGLLIESHGPTVGVGELCYVYGKRREKIPCQVVGFKEEKVLLMSLGTMGAIQPGAEVYPTFEVHQVQVGPSLLGRILGPLGEPIDGKGPLAPEVYYPVKALPPDPLKRRRIDEVLPTGIKAIDSLLTLGRGQRVGIFAGSGVGKSTLLGMLARSAHADVNVIALIGERGREVREFIERDLTPAGLAKSVVVVATAEKPAPMRSKAAYVATSVAEYFRDTGKNVLLLMDSMTRFAWAEREMGLAVGEPIASRGYPPSVFASLPELLERAGNGVTGSITALYTLLMERDDLQDPLVDWMRALLDGHIVLSRKLTSAALFPPIDVLESLSRVMSDLVAQKHAAQAARVRQLLQTYREAEDLIHLGAYVHGSNPKIDEAIAKVEVIRDFLKQSGSPVPWEEMEARFDQI